LTPNICINWAKSAFRLSGISLLKSILLRRRQNPGKRDRLYLWFHYPEAGTYNGKLETGGAENFDRYHVTAPKVEEEVTAHFILRLTDKGSPALTRYKRVIVTITP